MPHYRRGGEVSAYALLEKRFGVWAGSYASLCHLLTQLARMGSVMYMMALPLSVIDFRGMEQAMFDLLEQPALRKASGSA